MNIQDFIDKHQIEMSTHKVGHNPNMVRDEWSATASHWQCEIKQVGKGHKPLSVSPMFVFYSMGSAHKGKPQTASVLDSLAMDASMADQTFDQWCGEFGYDSDSRKSLQTYEACAKIRRDLEALIGSEAVRELIEEVERL